MNHLKCISTAMFLSTMLLLSSCQQSLEVPPNVIAENESEITKAFILPKGVEAENEEEISTFLQDVTEEQMAVLEKNYVIMTYLVDNNLYEEVHDELSKGQLFTDVDLNTYFPYDRLNGLADYNSPKISDRGTTWHYVGNIGHYLEEYPHYCHLRHYHQTYFDNHCQCNATIYYYQWSC